MEKYIFYKKVYVSPTENFYRAAFFKGNSKNKVIRENLPKTVISLFPENAILLEIKIEEGSEKTRILACIEYIFKTIEEQNRHAEEEGVEYRIFSEQSIVDNILNEEEEDEIMTRNDIEFFHYIFDYVRKPAKQLYQPLYNLKDILTEEQQKMYNTDNLVVCSYCKGTPKAILMAAINKETNKYYIGWAQCDTRSYGANKIVNGEEIEVTLADRFNKNEAKLIANGRIISQAVDGKISDKLKETFPASLKPHLDKFLNRCAIYYKEATPAFDYLNEL